MRMYYLQLPHLRHTRWASATGYKYPQLLPHENLIPRSLYCECRSSVTRPRQCTSIMFPCIVLFNYQRPRVPHRKPHSYSHNFFKYTRNGYKNTFSSKAVKKQVANMQFSKNTAHGSPCGLSLGTLLLYTHVFKKSNKSIFVRLPGKHTIYSVGILKTTQYIVFYQIT